MRTLQDQLHQRIVERLKNVETWFEEKSQGLHFPVYSSYDIRDATYKAAIVDANIYPGGFNNICDIDQENAPELMRSYLDNHYGKEVKKLLLLSEEHTSNAYYWENVYTLTQIIKGAGREVKVAIPRDLLKPIEVETAKGNQLEVHSAKRQGDHVQIDDYQPQLIISNNDFSEEYAEWSEGLSLPINPPRQLGWYQRKKDLYFQHYNDVVKEFAELLDLDPWLLQVETEVFRDFNLSNQSIRDDLAEKVDLFVARIAAKYKEHGIEETPFVVVKNNSGTYGLAVVQVASGEEIKAFNNKSRKKMKAAKGGGGVNQVILQEGIPSFVKSGEEVSEPSIYMVGRELAGGFLRAHSKKSPRESLNSPGAVYRRLCVSDLNISVEGNPLENTYGWLARLGLLAIGRESAAMDIKYAQYH